MLLHATRNNPFVRHFHPSIMPLAFQVANLAVKPPKVGENGYQGFSPRKETLPKGYQSRDGARALSEDMIAEHDVAVKVRDGCTLYCDIYRPVSSDRSNAKVPAIVAWSPFGKKHTGIDMMSKVRLYRRLQLLGMSKD
jgi:predicted acyl esterase